MFLHFMSLKFIFNFFLKQLLGFHTRTIWYPGFFRKVFFSCDVHVFSRKYFSDKRIILTSETGKMTFRKGELTDVRVVLFKMYYQYWVTISIFLILTHEGSELSSNFYRLNLYLTFNFHGLKFQAKFTILNDNLDPKSRFNNRWI